ncbi:hypothetical protein MMC13_001854 [Lambiella insularis]|nr:hypothetical protein [Lambiella insularis]
MDVDRRSLHWQLQKMLRALAAAHFVAVDFELSGIQSKVLYRLNAASKSTGSNQQTLQERYKEVKEAAERYQILQVGITIVQEDLTTGTYVTRPYNFYLNPIMEIKLDIERIFSYQSGAVDFLLKHGFNMEAPFTKGVPYLSREEESIALALEISRLSKSHIADIHLRADEVEAIRFVRKVRVAIQNWDKHKHTPQDYLNIAPEGHNIIQYPDGRGLNSYQKRLIHQLVRAEFPHLVSVSRGTFMQIIPLDKKREAALQKSKMRAFEEKLARQVGLRWIVEGMVGGKLDNIDPVTFASCNDSTTPVWLDVQELNREFNEIKSKLAHKKTVLVGHNAFMDLINFYKCFFGALPDTVAEFQCIMHELFPLIIDTKYMATHNNTDPNARSGLEELHADLRKQTVPGITLHKDHAKYNEVAIAHEAGYDAFVTAQVLIRLSAKLEAAGRYIDSEGEEHRSAGEVSVLPTRTDGVATADNEQEPLTAVRDSEKKKIKGKGKEKEKTLFSHAGRYDVLQGASGNNEEDEEEHFEDVHAENTTANILVGAPVTNEWIVRDSPPKVLRGAGSTPSRLMPPWGSDFWNVYGNKLRVNGTREGVCRLSGA